MPTLEVNRLSKWYGPVCGVEDVSFTIDPGEVFGYLGPNGSGKTTTLRCIMGLIRPSAGGVRVFGDPVVTGRATQHVRIGYLPGEFRIWRSLRAERALRVVAALGGCDSAKAWRKELAERLDLELDRRVGQLSKGNRQKIAVIAAFQHQPDLLILDEPTSGLDPLVRQTVLELIREMAGAGASVLLSSHDLGEVSAVCGRVGILREGRLIEVASIAKIIESEERRLHVWFRDRALMPLVPLGALPMVRVIAQQPGALQLAYRGNCDALLRWVATHGIERIATPESSLEEAFIQYYAGPSKSPSAAPAREPAG